MAYFFFFFNYFLAEEDLELFKIILESASEKLVETNTNVQLIEKTLFQQLSILWTQQSPEIEEELAESEELEEPEVAQIEKKRERETEPELKQPVLEVPLKVINQKRTTVTKKRRSNKTNADIIMRKFVGKGKPQEQVPDCFLCCSVKVCNNRIKKAQPAQTIAKVEELENAYRAVAERLDQHDEFDNRYREYFLCGKCGRGKKQIPNLAVLASKYRELCETVQIELYEEIYTVLVKYEVQHTMMDEEIETGPPITDHQGDYLDEDDEEFVLDVVDKSELLQRVFHDLTSNPKFMLANQINMPELLKTDPDSEGPPEVLPFLQGKDYTIVFQWSDLDSEERSFWICVGSLDSAEARWCGLDERSLQKAGYSVGRTLDFIGTLNTSANALMSRLKK